MAVSLSRLFKSFAYPESSGSSHVDTEQNAELLPPIHYPSAEAESEGQNEDNLSQDTKDNNIQERENQQLRAQRVTHAVKLVNNTQVPTPLTDRYLQLQKNRRHPNRPPFDPDTLWTLKHGKCPIMTELVDVVDESTLNAMPIEAVAVLDRINHKLSRYREWSTELNDSQEEWVCERKYVINKLIQESIPEALNYYEQLLRFSPHRTKNNIVQGNMTAGDLLTDLFLEIDYELDELLDELHQMVVSRLASTHRYVKSRTQN
ncbi:hypothetical protein [Psychrobacter sp. I-STPA10]|uniref:hypothetical protein n=1 Tax=Psychrobacter sp. I-STPA10 TaxID=2585769 RepID=UPI001E355C84|nr:hypothetical protein [Psychrobacter sp. I-STPA10]